MGVNGAASDAASAAGVDNSTPESTAGRSNSSITGMLRQAARPVKPGVLVWDAPEGYAADEAERKLTEAAARGDADAARQPPRAARSARRSLHRPASRPDLEAGRAQFLRRQIRQCALLHRCGEAALLRQRKERMCGRPLAFSRAAAAARSARAGMHALDSRAAGATAAPSPPGVQAGARGSTPQQRVGTPAPWGRGSMAVAEGEALFAAAEDPAGAPTARSFRLLALCKQRSSLCMHGASDVPACGYRKRQAARTPPRMLADLRMRAAPLQAAAAAAVAQRRCSCRVAVARRAQQRKLRKSSGCAPERAPCCWMLRLPRCLRIPDLIGLLGTAPDLAASQPEKSKQGTSAGEAGGRRQCMQGAPRKGQIQVRRPELMLKVPRRGNTLLGRRGGTGCT